MKKIVNQGEFLGRMNDPDAAAALKGPCGDEMEFYLVIKDKRITDIKYYTEGCDATKACGQMTARLVKNKTIDEAMHISAGQVKNSLKGLSDDHLHCTILSVSTLYRALADYILKL